MTGVSVRVAVPPVAGLSVCGRELAGMVEAALESLGLAGSAVDVRLTGDEEVARLNAAFRGLPGPTNVLSFPGEGAGQGGPEADGPDLGQVVVSRDAVLREARLYGQEPREHLARLLVHGLLHLSGAEHGQDMEARTEAAVSRVVSTTII